METRNNYYYGIDVVRFLAALWVMLFHVGFTTWASARSHGAHLSQGAYTTPELAPWVWFGNIGVEVFFVISGFVIANSAANATPISFLKGRMLRLYPGAWICATMTALVLLFEGGFGLRRYLSSLLLFPPNGPFIDGQYWTLGVEIVFYAAVFGLLLLGWYRHLALFAGALLAVSSAYLIALAFVPHLGFLSRGGWRLLLLYHGVFFAWGMLFFHFALGLWRRWMTAAMALSLVAIGFQLHRKAVQTLGSAQLAPPDFHYTGMYVGFAIGVGAILLSIRYRLAFASLPAGVLKLMRNLGLATYPLYLLHFTIGVVLTRNLVRLGVPAVAAVLIAALLLTLLALFVALKLERPVRHLFARLLDAIDGRLPESGGIASWLRRSETFHAPHPG